MNSNYTIAESYTLPSKGMIYPVEVNPEVKITSMTTQHEMQRLAPSDTLYKNMCEIIDSCLVENLGISSYDLCLGDYLFLIHKLRVVTYGPNYKLSSVCPYCGFQNEGEIDLDDLPVMEFSEDIKKYFEFTLPKSGKHIKLKMQTPRMLDKVLLRVKDFKKKAQDKEQDPTLIYTIQEMIDTVDGEVLQDFKLEKLVRELPMADTNMILAYADKINSSIGVNTELENKCDFCNKTYKSVLKINQEFFRPALDL